MGTAQLQADLLNVIVQVTFWTSALFIPVVSRYWPWWKHFYGKAAISIDVLLSLVLLPAVLRRDLGIDVASISFGWFTIAVFALVPMRTVWLAWAIWKIQRQERITPGHDIKEEQMTMQAEDQVTVSAQGEDRSDFQPVESWGSDAFGFAKASEGVNWTGATFAGNWKLLAGRPRGAYHFLHPGEDPAIQARHFIAVIQSAGGLVPGDMLAVDSEIMSGAPVPARAHLPVTAAALESATASTVDTASKAFLDEVAALVGSAHHPLLVYTMNAVGQFMSRTAAAYPLLWFAHPSQTAPSPAMIAPWKSWAIWQWGASANGDKDAYNGPAADLEAWLARYEHKAWVTWTSDGSLSLVQLGRERKALPSTILRKTVEEFSRFEFGLAGYINAGDLETAAIPAGAKLRIPG